MPVVQISTWPIKNKVALQTMMEEITRVIHQTSGAPLDKISVFVNEIPPSHWADAGISGSDPDFRERSRRLAYEDDR
ncbi:tautomerase family protein [Methylosinus sp. RM1]|uniref:tautomerase family protein n=1 Tax=Methylosinus sp. RM1 TaxID=2583817 RepID=UPI00140E1799|nr:tautomerase family protein [Methylosinus sp. RM1]